MPGYQLTEEYRRYVNESDTTTLLNDMSHHVRLIDPDGLYERLKILCKAYAVNGWIYEFDIERGRNGADGMDLSRIQYCPVCGWRIRENSVLQAVIQNEGEYDRINYPIDPPVKGPVGDWDGVSAVPVIDADAIIGKYKKRRRPVHEKHIKPDEEHRQAKRAQRVQKGTARALDQQRKEHEMRRWRNLDI